MGFNLESAYWDRIRGYVSEHRVDARWILRGEEDDKPYGSLRIVSHPDLPPGHLRSIFIYVTNKRKRSDVETLKVVEDFQMDIKDLEVFSIDDDIETETETFEGPHRELEGVFGVKIFE